MGQVTARLAQLDQGLQALAALVHFLFGQDRFVQAEFLHQGALFRLADFHAQGLGLLDAFGWRGFGLAFEVSFDVTQILVHALVGGLVLFLGATLGALGGGLGRFVCGSFFGCGFLGRGFFGAGSGGFFGGLLHLGFDLFSLGFGFGGLFGLGGLGGRFLGRHGGSFLHGLGRCCGLAGCLDSRFLGRHGSSLHHRFFGRCGFGSGFGSSLGSGFGFGSSLDGLLRLLSGHGTTSGHQKTDTKHGHSQRQNSRRGLGWDTDENPIWGFFCGRQGGGRSFGMQSLR